MKTYTTKAAVEAGLDPLKLQAQVDVEWVRTLPIKDGMKILDVGCFKGRDLRQLWAYLPNCKLTGVDSYQPAIAFCKEKHADMNATWICGDANALPFKDKEFDVVYENGMLVEHPESELIQKEMERVGKVVYYS